MNAPVGPPPPPPPPPPPLPPLTGADKSNTHLYGTHRRPSDAAVVVPGVKCHSADTSPSSSSEGVESREPRGKGMLWEEGPPGGLGFEGWGGVVGWWVGMGLGWFGLAGLGWGWGCG